MKKNPFIAFIIMLGLVASAPAFANIKIGTVDMQKALQTVNKGKEARSSLEKDYQAKKKDLDKEEESIVKMRDELQKQSLVMNEKTLQKKQAELQERFVEFQKKRGQYQMEIQQKEQTLTAPIIDKLKTVVEELAKSKGYTVVLERSQNMVIYSQDQDDFTNELIEKFNKMK